MKINRVHISDIIDARRMDPIFFRYGTMQFGRNFRLEAISTCIVDIQSGVGAGKKDQADKNNGIIQVRPTNIDRNGMLRLCHLYKKMMFYLIILIARN